VRRLGGFLDVMDRLDGMDVAAVLPWAPPTDPVGVSRRAKLKLARRSSLEGSRGRVGWRGGVRGYGTDGGGDGHECSLARLGGDLDAPSDCSDAVGDVLQTDAVAGPGDIETDAVVAHLEMDLIRLDVWTAPTIAATVRTRALVRVG
jgi:hypothetical protein